MNDDPRCPECGSTFTIDTQAQTDVEYHPGYHVRGTPLPTRRVTLTVAFCDGCPYSHEIDTRFLV